MDVVRVESVLLGSVMLVNELWAQAEVLTEHDFAMNPHKRIFRRMRELADAGSPIDEFGLIEELGRHGELELVGGRAYITSLTDGIVQRKDISSLLATIRDYAIRRDAARAGERLQHLAGDGTVCSTALAEVAATFAEQYPEPCDAAPPRCSEESLALRFSRRHAAELRYVAALGRWYRWDGKLWREDDTLAVFDLVRTICRRASAECGEGEKATATRLAGGATVAAVERLARADRQHAATIDQWDCDQFLLNTPAGTVDLRTGEIHAHQPRQYLTKITAAGPGSECPLWLKFLERITNHSPELQSFLQRIVGYCLTGSTREHAIFFLYGTGANGKSVFLSTIGGMLRDYAKTAPVSSFTASNNQQHPTDIAGLRGARLVTAIETETGSRWAESKIKTLTGGDKITARFMRQDFFEFFPQFKLFVAGNHKPELQSVDEAMRRRLHMIPFIVTIEKEERDPELTEKLRAEIPGILGWAIEGCLAWQREGLNPPAVVRNATDQYLAAEDALGMWIEDHCVTGPRHWVAGAALFKNWSQWCDRAGERPGTQKHFAQALEARGFRQERTNKARGFAGIALRSDVGVTDVTGSSISDVTRARVRPI
jgi:putative DNA primase/helicase